MAGKSELTERAELLLDAMEARYTDLLKEWEVPFLMKQMTPEEAKRRLFAMTKEQRQAELGRIGVEGLLAALGIREV